MKKQTLLTRIGEQELFGKDMEEMAAQAQARLDAEERAAKKREDRAAKRRKKDRIMQDRMQAAHEAQATKANTDIFKKKASTASGKGQQAHKRPPLNGYKGPI